MNFRSLFTVVALPLLFAFAGATSTLASTEFSPADAEGRYVYLIEFVEPGLMAQHRQQRGAGTRFDFNASDMVAARDSLKSQQGAHLASIAAAVGRSVAPSHVYLVTHSGVAARLTPTEARQVNQLPGVASVQRERVYELATYRGPTFIGADDIWTGVGVPDGTGHEGAGMIAAILDTGIPAAAHASFANDPACGHGSTAPAKVLSSLDCASTDGSGLCNGPSPGDANGHGSHTASTVAGNRVTAAGSPPPSIPAPFTEISGVAPCASIRSYKTCPTSSCPGANLQAGLNSVLIHGDLDVVNYSISGGSNPWNDFDSIKLDMVDAGMFVAASAGNTSAGVPNPVGQVNHRGPWVMSVAASTRDGDMEGFVSITGPGTPPGNTQNISMDRGSASPVGSPLSDHPILRDASQPPGADGCNPGFDPDFFDGAIALIQRGTCPFTEKINNAAAAGADLVIIWNNVATPFSMDTTGQDPDTPAYSITLADGTALADFINANPGATADFDLDAAGGDVLAGFSFRGPTPAPLQHLQKPDITAPGVDIYAAVPGGYAFISGTSMSGPHVAGAGLLVAQSNPDWTPSEVKSALQMSAFKGGFKENGTTAWDWDDVGSGRADLTGAALAGLVMDETHQNYLDANPAIGGDVRTLNLPGLRNLDCTPSCSWTRTVRNTLGTASSWTASGDGVTAAMNISVSPSSFSFTGDTNETQVLTITAAPVDDLSSSIGFGEVILTEDSAQSPELHLTVAITGEPGEFDGPEIETNPNLFSFVLNPDVSSSQELTISNVGNEPLDWEIETEEVTGLRAPTRDFDGDFDLSNWTLVNTPAGVNGSFNTNPGPPIEVFVVGGNDGVGGNTDFQIEVPADGVISFNWGYQSTDTDCWDSGGYAINGVYTELACNNAAVPYFNGSATVPVSAGDIFAFRVFTDDGLFGAGTFGVTNFDFEGTEPQACDNPATVSWLSVNPNSGTTAAGNDDLVDVDVDSTGLAEGDYEANLCISSNDPDNSLVVIPVSLTVIDGTIEPPTIDVDPTGFTFNVVSGDLADDDLIISNLGDELLIWSIDTAEGVSSHDPLLDEALSIPNFTVVSPANGGSPQVFTVPAGVMSSGQVVGFSFEGTVDGITGNGDWASDMCMQIEGPDGSSYSVGGISASVANCNINPWDFQGGGSTNDGTYSSGHDDVWAFPPGADDDGDWTFTFIHGWDSGSANPMNWSDVTVTLHKVEEPSTCDTPSAVSWLSVNPGSGSTTGGNASIVAVNIDATGLAGGTYDAVLCVNSNDPVNPQVEVPVELNVTGAPEIDVDPTSISMMLDQDDSDDEVLTISNLGAATLNWEVDEDASPDGGLLHPVGAVTVPVTIGGQSGAGLSAFSGSFSDKSGGGSFDFLPRGGTTITHSSSMNVVPGTVACSPDSGTTTSANAFLRSFTLADFGISDAFNVTEVTFGIENLSSSQPITVNLYTVDGAFTYANMTLIGTETETLASQSLTLVTVPVAGTVPAGGTLAVEILPPDLSGTAAFFPGSNAAGQSAPSYIASTSCSINDPTDFTDIGFPNVHLVMSVTGTVGAGACEIPAWMGLSALSGTIAPSGDEEVTVTLDSTGLDTGLYEANICISSNDPVNSLVVIPVELEVALGADTAILEGTVESLGYCSDDPSAAAGAEIEVLGDSGAVFNTTADGDGFYTLTLDVNESPVTVTASAPNHLDGVESGVTLVAQGTTVVDFSLVLDSACATVSPEDIAASVPEGGSANVMLEIGNVNGAAQLDWTIDTAEAPSGDWRAHFPSTPYIAEPGSRDGISWLADEAAGHSGDVSGAVLPMGMGVPAYSTTGWVADGYISIDALVPGSMTVVNPTQPTTFFAGTFIDNDLSQHYVLASDGGASPFNSFGPIDTATGTFTSQGLVTGAGTGSWTSMGWDHSTGTLYAVQVPAGGTNNLYTIDPDTLQATLVGNIAGGGVAGGAIIIAIAISPDGLMYAIDIIDDVLVAVDKTNAEAAVIGPLGVNANFAQDMDFDPTDGTLYWAGYLGGGNSQIFVVNTDTGATNSLGNVPNGNELLNFSIALPSAASCTEPATIPWLSVAPEFGSTAAGSSDMVNVLFDADGLAPGTYVADLCVATNDAQNALIVVPVELEVTPMQSADVSFEDLVQTYTGDPLEVTVVTDPPGLAVEVTYDGLATPPTDAGSYAVEATVTEPGYFGSASDTFVIEPATASILFDDLQQFFTGDPLEPTITTDPAGLTIIVTYDGSSTVPSAVGQYLVEVEVDEQNWIGSDSATFEILEPLGDEIFHDRFEE